MLRSLVVSSVLFCSFIYGSAGLAQEYPSKPVRILTASAGGGADFTARQVAQGITAPLGQPIVVDNRPNVTLGELFSKAAPDGYTLHVNGNSVWIRPLLVKMPYDAIKDFAPISLIERVPYIIAVHPSVPVKTIKELIALAKARPGELNYGSASVAGPSHLAAEFFTSLARVNIVGVQYKGNAAAINALVAGEVQMTIIDAGLLANHIKSGRLRPLAVTSASPSAMVPAGVPTAVSSGLAGYVLGSVTGIWAPARTPDAIIKRLNQEIVRHVQRPEVKERFFNAGVEVIGSSPEEFAEFIRTDTVNMAKIIKDANIKIDP